MLLMSEGHFVESTAWWWSRAPHLGCLEETAAKCAEEVSIEKIKKQN